MLISLRKNLDFLKTQFDLYVKENPEPRQGSSTCSVTEGLSDIVYYVADTDRAFAQEVFDRIEKNKEKICGFCQVNKKILKIKF